MAGYGLRRACTCGAVMSTPVFVLVSMAGGLGAGSRFAVDSIVSRAVTARTAGNIPWGTTTVNLTGSFLLGLLLGLAASIALPRGWQMTAGSGFLGGYTTFSAASVEIVQLLRNRRWAAGAIIGLGSIVGATAVAALGMWTGGWIGVEMCGAS